MLCLELCGMHDVPSELNVHATVRGVKNVRVNVINLNVKERDW